MCFQFTSALWAAIKTLTVCRQVGIYKVVWKHEELKSCWGNARVQISPLLASCTGLFWHAALMDVNHPQSPQFSCHLFKEDHPVLSFRSTRTLESSLCRWESEVQRQELPYGSQFPQWVIDSAGGTGTQVSGLLSQHCFLPPSIHLPPPFSESFERLWWGNAH